MKFSSNTILYLTRKVCRRLFLGMWAMPEPFWALFKPIRCVCVIFFTQTHRNKILFYLWVQFNFEPFWTVGRGGQFHHICLSSQHVAFLITSSYNLRKLTIFHPSWIWWPWNANVWNPQWKISLEPKSRPQNFSKCRKSDELASKHVFEIFHAVWPWKWIMIEVHFLFLMFDETDSFLDESPSKKHHFHVL